MGFQLLFQWALPRSTEASALEKALQEKVFRAPAEDFGGEVFAGVPGRKFFPVGTKHASWASSVFQRGPRTRMALNSASGSCSAQIPN